MSRRETNHHDQCGCGCGGFDRREFMTILGAGTAGLMFTSTSAEEIQAEAAAGGKRKPKIHVVFLFPPSSTFAGKDGWWSWPGNDFDAEGRMKQYGAELRKMATGLDVALDITERPLYGAAETSAFAKRAVAEGSDGVLMVMFYNNSFDDAQRIRREIGEVPACLYVGLGVTHRRAKVLVGEPGLHYIQSLDNFDAIEHTLRMFATKQRMATGRILGIDGNDTARGNLPFFGTEVVRIPTAEYVATFDAVAADKLPPVIETMRTGAREEQGLTPDSLPNAARAHLAIQSLCEKYDADAVTMRCLRMGQYKPCMSFAHLNGSLFPAACEYDINACLALMLVRNLFDLPGFMHNPSYESEGEHYYASHCTCTPKLHGPGTKDLPFLIRRFAHTNDRSAAIQVFWQKDDPVTLLTYGPGAIQVCGGRVVASHEMPPVGGCTTNVLVDVTDGKNALDAIANSHTVVFCGDHAKRLRQFGNLLKMKVS